MSAELNKATVRTLSVLSAIAERGGDHGVSELADRLGMTKTMVHRALATLEGGAFVVRSANPSRYRLGFGLLELSPAEVDATDIVDLVRPFLERLHTMTSETVTLGVRSGARVVYIFSIRGKGSVAERVTLGESVPLHANPAGQAIMAFLPDEDLDALLSAPLERFTERTIVDPVDLRRHLERVRTEGAARGYGSHLRDVTGFAMPLFDGADEVCASVTLSGPAQRLPDVRLDDLVAPVAQVVAQMNRRTHLLVPRFR